jgi:hypothetical protein
MSSIGRPTAKEQYVIAWPSFSNLLCAEAATLEATLTFFFSYKHLDTSAKLLLSPRPHSTNTKESQIQPYRSPTEAAPTSVLITFGSRACAHLDKRLT